MNEQKPSDLTSEQKPSDLTSGQKLPDMEHLPEDVELILLSGRIGIIANAIADKLHIDGLTALDLFYRSDTCRHLHDKSSGLYLLGELYIADEFILEMQQKQ